MARDEHNKAAEHHENAAKSHRAAAEHHGKGDHTKGRNTQPTPSNILKVLANTASKPMPKASSRSKSKGPAHKSGLLSVRFSKEAPGNGSLQPAPAWLPRWALHF